MAEKPTTEILELIEYVRWYGGFKNSDAAISWLDKYLKGWRQVHDTPVTVLDWTPLDT